MTSMVLLLTVMVAMVPMSELFLLEDNCLAAPPCECNTYNVYCQGEVLSSVPTFLPSHKTIPYLYINLAWNFIRVIRANAFQVLTTASPTLITLDMNSNNIEIVDDKAFAGIEKALGQLILSYNWLEYVPPALATLTNLEELQISNNNILTFDPTIFAGFGNSLKYFDFSIDQMRGWPTDAINKLHQLRSIYVVDQQVVNWTIPANGLDGAKNSLETIFYDLVDSDYSNQRLPVPFCGMNRLRKLSIYKSQWTTNGDILLDNCNTVMTSMESLELFHFQNLNITQIFHLFPSLTHLHLDQNYLTTFRLDQYNTGSLKVLRMDWNNFNSIPADINRITSLESLSLASNLITTISGTSFNALVNLDFLDLSYNSITSIAPNAFANNQKLESLNLEGNSLTTIPTLVTELPALQIFHISNGPEHMFDCSCSGLDNVAKWNVDNLVFTNVCNATGHTGTIKIKTFIQTDLQACP